MKNLILFALATLSGSVFAQVCEVQMLLDQRQVIQTFRAYGDPKSCQEGMKQCRKSIRMDYSNHPQYPNNRLDCASVGNYNQAPQPYPQNYPQPNPLNYQYPSSTGYASGPTCLGYVDDLQSVASFSRDYYTDGYSSFAAFNVYPASLQCKQQILENHRQNYYQDTRYSPSRFIQLDFGAYPQGHLVTCNGIVDDVNSVASWNSNYYTEAYSEFASYQVVPSTVACKKAILDEHRRIYYSDSRYSQSRRITTTIQY